MEVKFYSQAEVEKKGFVKNSNTLWLKKGMAGKSVFLKCGGCNRFFEGGTTPNENVWVEAQCPFCAIKYRIPITKDGK